MNYYVQSTALFVCYNKIYHLIQFHFLCNSRKKCCIYYEQKVTLLHAQIIMYRSTLLTWSQIKTDLISQACIRFQISDEIFTPRNNILVIISKIFVKKDCCIWMFPNFADANKLNNICFILHVFANTPVHLLDVNSHF